MTKFQCIEQVASMTFFNGPSGNNYNSVLGQTFEVTDAKDVEYFSKHNSFKKIGALSKPVKMPSEEEKLAELLVKAKIDKSSTKKIVEAYDTIDNLRADLEAGTDVAAQLSLNKKELSAIKKLLKLE